MEKRAKAARGLVSGSDAVGGRDSPSARAMVVAYVRLHASPTAPPSGRVYALLLPSADTDEWDEVDVRRSALGGFGAFPVHGPARHKATCGFSWADTGTTPVLMPYWGKETVTKDDHSRKALIDVLKGNFELLTLGELQKHHDHGRAYAVDGLFAVPGTPGGRGAPLPPATKLLQVSDGTAACYLLADDVKTALHLTGVRSHLFDLLCAHAKHEHAERHLATHVATIQRKEEGFVLVNAHPAWEDPVSLCGMVNEPSANERSTLKMVYGYARFLDDSEPEMRERGLKQSRAGVAAWRKHTLRPAGKTGAGVGEWFSERMVMYMSTRKSYPASEELTVDYGKSYARDYQSGEHRASCAPLYSVPKDGYPKNERADWPSLPGWFSVSRPPVRRPAFKFGADGRVKVCRDEPEVVAARREALGYPRTTMARAASTAPPSPPPRTTVAPRKDAASPRTVTDEVHAASTPTKKAGAKKRSADHGPGDGGARGSLTSMFAAVRKRLRAD